MKINNLLVVPLVDAVGYIRQYSDWHSICKEMALNMSLGVSGHPWGAPWAGWTRAHRPPSAWKPGTLCPLVRCAPNQECVAIVRQTLTAVAGNGIGCRSGGPPTPASDTTSLSLTPSDRKRLWGLTAISCGLHLRNRKKDSVRERRGLDKEGSVWGVCTWGEQDDHFETAVLVLIKLKTSQVFGQIEHAFNDLSQTQLSWLLESHWFATRETDLIGSRYRAVTTTQE